jgi:tryptophan synthase alpha chain
MNLIGYLSCGYPSLEESMRFAGIYLEAGCDGIEMSIPPVDPKYEPDHIAASMRVALSKCSDYNLYLESIQSFQKQNPAAYTMNLIYGETLRLIGIEKYLEFYFASGMAHLLGVNFDAELTAEMEQAGVSMSATIDFGMTESRIQNALRLKKGLIYLAATPAPTTIIREGCDTTKKCIEYLRNRGITLPIYCGVGIRTPEQVSEMKSAGADGVFIGGSLLNQYDDEKGLFTTIQELKKATK